MSGVVEMVCLVVKFENDDLMNNFESFWNVSCFCDFDSVWFSVKLVIGLGCPIFNVFGDL